MEKVNNFVVASPFYICVAPADIMSVEIENNKRFLKPKTVMENNAFPAYRLYIFKVKEKNHDKFKDIMDRIYKKALLLGYRDYQEVNTALYESFAQQKGEKMKGYLTSSCYMGYIPSINKYIPFPTEQEYVEYLSEKEETT